MGRWWLTGNWVVRRRRTTPYYVHTHSFSKLMRLEKAPRGSSSKLLCWKSLLYDKQTSTTRGFETSKRHACDIQCFFTFHHEVSRKHSGTDATAMDIIHENQLRGIVRDRLQFPFPVGSSWEDVLRSACMWGQRPREYSRPFKIIKPCQIRGLS